MTYDFSNKQSTIPFTLFGVLLEWAPLDSYNLRCGAVYLSKHYYDNWLAKDNVVFKLAGRYLYNMPYAVVEQRVAEFERIGYRATMRNYLEEVDSEWAIKGLRKILPLIEADPVLYTSGNYSHMVQEYARSLIR